MNEINDMSLFALLVYSTATVLIHELGHYLTAKYVGIEVTEFNIGTGYNLFSFTRLGTKFSLNLVVLGGNIRIYLDKNPTRKDYLNYMLVGLGGPVANLLTGMLALYMENDFLTIMSFGSCVGNLIPTSGSDGHQIYIILKKLYRKEI